jgi:hypothetical protein
MGKNGLDTSAEATDGAAKSRDGVRAGWRALGLGSVNAQS